MVELKLGDCLAVMRDIESESIDAVIADPPYGVDYQSGWVEEKRRKPKVLNDAKPFIWWLYEAFRLTRVGGCLLCFCGWQTQETFRVAIEAAGFAVKSHVIWDRIGHGMGDLRGAFAPQHDVIWFATKGRFEFAGKRPRSVISVQRLSGSNLIHPNQKPVQLMEQLIIAVVPNGGKILDPFMGVGTTARAARNLGRDYVGIEQAPEYFQQAMGEMQKG